MRAISMTPFDALAVADGLNSSGPFNWSTDSLPPNMWELVAIHSAEKYPPDAAALATAERLTPTGLELPGVIVAVGRASRWHRTRYTPKEFSFRLEHVRKLKIPIAAFGSLGLWPVDLGIEKLIWDDLGEPMPKVRG